MGEAWVNKEILGSEPPRHALGRWQETNPRNPVVPHVESLLEYLFSRGNIKFNWERLEQKLNAEFAPTLAELEWAVWLAQGGFSVVIEPFAPKKGPDLEVHKDNTYFVEIQDVGPSGADARFNVTCTDVFSRLEKIPSRYHVIVSLEAGYRAYSRPLIDAVGAVADTLEKLTREPAKKATLYYISPKEKILNLGGDIEWGPVNYDNPQELVEKVKRHERASQAGFVARFFDRGEEHETSVVSVSRAGSRADYSHERIKRILGDKRTQLPRDQRGIIVLDVSDLLLGDETVFSALYGDLRMRFGVGPKGMVGEPEWDRASNGFFRNTSRVSAVVAYRRAISGDLTSIEMARHVFPTNNGQPDTIQLTLPELKCFGDVPADVHHLSAENLPPKKTG